MKIFYQNLSTEELIKKRALGSESLTEEAHEIIFQILKERGVDIPPLYEKPIDIEEMSPLLKVEEKSDSSNLFAAIIMVIASVIFSEFLKEILKTKGIVINLVFTLSILTVWFSYRKKKSNHIHEGEYSDLIGKDGFTELMMCCVTGKNERIKEILSYKPDVDMCDIKGYTALMYAASNGQIESVKLLLESGANKNISTKRGNSAMSFATRNNHYEIIKLLS